MFKCLICPAGFIRTYLGLPAALVIDISIHRPLLRMLSSNLYTSDFRPTNVRDSDVGLNAFEAAVWIHNLKLLHGGNVPLSHRTKVYFAKMIID